jgi:hypothetical protein
VVSTNNLTDLYAVMQSFESIQPEDFNLEGIIYSGDNWYLYSTAAARVIAKHYFTSMLKS